MFKLLLSTLLLANLLLSAPLAAKPQESPLPPSGIKHSSDCAPFLRYTIRRLHSQVRLDLCELTAGKPLLIVNTASHCGFTPQFEGLEAIYKKYQSKGLVVLGFPSDDFFQEEDEEKDTAKVCFVNYGVTFPMLKTINVRGSDAHPIFKHLADKTTSPKWNFYKYLVSRDGKAIRHFNSRVTPDDAEFIQAIEAAL
ncbi:glutathione peroxidase [Thalassomonas viridans]|uniref:Glutathione peroxidase n=1 Tax=Thalassomonas viridans TaxID=137584 RepID=A0AAE9Z396_9GAMM|nr:glutathione peroxidase [Thalassomonas viridans]WDE05815.1 glutathione peroxidase [Thalassomonas viridans]